MEKHRSRYTGTHRHTIPKRETSCFVDLGGFSYSLQSVCRKRENVRYSMWKTVVEDLLLGHAAWSSVNLSSSKKSVLVQMLCRIAALMYRYMCRYIYIYVCGCVCRYKYTHTNIYICRLSRSCWCFPDKVTIAELRRRILTLAHRIAAALHAVKYISLRVIYFRIALSPF